MLGKGLTRSGEACARSGHFSNRLHGKAFSLVFFNLNISMEFFTTIMYIRNYYKNFMINYNMQAKFDNEILGFNLSVLEHAQDFSFTVRVFFFFRSVVDINRSGFW